MLEQIKRKLFEKYKTTETKWIYLSVFDVSGKMLFSRWVLMTDKTMDKLIENLYYAMIEWKYKLEEIKIVLIDVVWQIIESTPEDIMNSSPKEYWFCMISIDKDKVWTILPDMIWVADSKNALFLMKNKFWIEGKVMIYKFKSERISITN